MVKKKYAGEKEIRDKINELFTYRKLTELMHYAQLDKDHRFIDQLTDVQYQIYQLDAYLEGAWILEKDTLKSLWDHIEKALRKLIPDEELIKPLLREIREYERIELNMRRSKWPTGERFKKFYTIKSCDVRLIRKLIYLARPELDHTWKESAWRYYDLITEINDDIADLREDLKTYNGNRFLIAVLRKGNQKTETRYKDQLQAISKNAKKYFQKHTEGAEHTRLYDWTLTRASETLELLTTTLQENDHSIFTSSLLLKKME
jgi:hypothetical protein